MKRIDPKIYGLPPKTVLKKLNTRKIAIVIDRKSRIIMADGKKIIEKAEIIKNHNRALEVCLVTTAPVCSKTSGFLREKGVTILNKKGVTVD